MKEISRVFEEVRNQVDIVDIVGQLIPLERKGSDYVGLCPFHQDHTPSFSVSPSKQICHCFVCKNGGNVFTFVQQYEHLTPIESLRRVCELGKIPLPEGFEVREKAKTEDKYLRYYQLMSDLTNFYKVQLSTEAGSKALEYLHSRNITSADIDYFNIGYCDEEGKSSIQFLRNKGYKDDEIITCGVGVQSKAGLVDRLKGRVIFTIANTSGKVVAFSGRRLANDDSAKYVNSPETIIFKKSNVLYNYHNAAKTAKAEGYCYLVEGYFDAIALHKSGIKNVVATMGTAFTKDHIQALEELKCEYRLFFDSDEPGQATIYKSIDALKTTKLNVMVVKQLIGYKDIDEVLAKAGPDKVVSYANNLQNPIQFKLDYLSKRTNFSNHESMKEFIVKSLTVLSDYDLDSVDFEVYFTQIAKLTGLSIKTIENEYAKIKKENTHNDEINYEDYFDYSEPVSPKNVEKILTKYEQVDHQILKLMIENENNIVFYKGYHVSLCTRQARKLASIIVYNFDNRLGTDIGSLFNNADEDTVNLLNQLINEKYPPGLEVGDLVKIINEDYSKSIDIDDLKRKINETTDIEEKIRLGKELVELKKRQ